jgi:capsular polysaccharide biosynthesis protein
VRESYSQRALTAGDVYRALWRHKFFIVLMTAVFVGATWYVTSRQTQRYEASTLVRVQERGDTGSGSGSLLAGQTLAQTYAQIVDAGALSPQIKILVAGCNSGKPTRLKAILPVAPIRVRAPNAAATGTQTVTPRAAARRARRVAAARRSLRRTYRIACGSMGVTPRRPAPPRRVSQVHLSSNPVQDLDLVTVAARSRNPRNATIAANAAPWALRAFIRKSGSRTEKIVTVKAATLPTSPVSRQLPLKLAVAAMIGLIFNGALALLFEFFRDRLPEPDQLGRQVGLPVLAVVPTLRLHRAETLASSRPLPESAPNGEGSARSSGPRVGPE